MCQLMSHYILYIISKKLHKKKKRKPGNKTRMIITTGEKVSIDVIKIVYSNI